MKFILLPLLLAFTSYTYCQSSKYEPSLINELYWQIDELNYLDVEYIGGKMYLRVTNGFTSNIVSDELEYSYTNDLVELAGRLLDNKFLKSSDEENIVSFRFEMSYGLYADGIANLGRNTLLPYVKKGKGFIPFFMLLDVDQLNQSYSSLLSHNGINIDQFCNTFECIINNTQFVKYIYLEDTPTEYSFNFKMDKRDLKVIQEARMLEYLYISGIEIKEVPSKWQKLSNLRTLIIKNCNTSSFDIPLNELINLRYLDISKNRLSDVTLDAINLKSVDLSHNNLSKLKIKSPVYQLTNIDVSYNKVNEIKTDVDGLSNINYLNLSHNDFKVFDDDYFPSLAHIYLQGNDMKVVNLKRTSEIKSLGINALIDNSINSFKGLKNLILEDYTMGLLMAELPELSNLKVNNIDTNDQILLNKYNFPMLASLHLNTCKVRLQEQMFSELNIKDLSFSDFDYISYTNMRIAHPELTIKYTRNNQEYISAPLDRTTYRNFLESIDEDNNFHFSNFNFYSKRKEYLVADEAATLLNPNFLDDLPSKEFISYKLRHASVHRSLYPQHDISYEDIGNDKLINLYMSALDKFNYLSAESRLELEKYEKAAKQMVRKSLVSAYNSFIEDNKDLVSDYKKELLTSTNLESAASTVSTLADAAVDYAELASEMIDIEGSRVLTESVGSGVGGGDVAAYAAAGGYVLSGILNIFGNSKRKKANKKLMNLQRFEEKQNELKDLIKRYN